MRLSVRTQIKSRVIDVQYGATTANIDIDIGNDVIITSSISNEAVEELRLKAGDKVSAIVKVSDLMVGR